MDTNYNISVKRGLNGTQIKTIAIIAMLIDHIAWGFVDTYTAPGLLMHVVGRLTAPIMCFFIAQGYVHTRSFKKYLLRLILFTFAAQIPYNLESSGQIRLDSLSVMYTLTLGLVAIYVYDKVKNKLLKWLLIIVIGIASIPGDWLFFGVAFCLIFYIFRNNFKKQCFGIISVGIIELVLMAGMAAVNGGSIPTTLLYNLFQFSIVLSLPVLSLYNGEKGGGKLSKWSFYVFYPLHLLILAVIKFYVY